MFTPYKHNYCKGRVTVEGRTFQIEFWEEDHFGLPWVYVSEIVVEEVRSHWYSRKKEMREVEHHIDDGWMAENRLEWALNRIERYLQREKDAAEELRQILAFCRMGGTDGA